MRLRNYLHLKLGLDQIVTNPEVRQALEEEAARGDENCGSRLIGKAFVTALENDATFFLGKTFPQ